jgi:bla regulator protein blaR1
MKKLSPMTFTPFTAAAAVLLLAACALPLFAHAQDQTNSKYANATITVATTGEGDDSLHFSSSGCSGNLSGVGIVVAINDGCWLWNEGADVPRGLWLRIAPDKISFRHDGRDYVITDAATVKRMRDLCGPLVDILERQDMLGAQQRALGDKQRDLGEQQRDVKVSVPDMNADFEKVEADAKRLSAGGATQDELGELQSELGDLQSRLGDLQSRAGDAQSKLGDQQSALGDQQSALGDKQSVLGDKAKELAPGIAEKMRDILNQSVQNGTAKSK